MPFPSIAEKSGSESASGFAVESSYGVPVAATTFLPSMSNTLEVDPGWFSPELMMGTRDLHVFNMQGEAKYEGAVEGPLFPSNAMQLFVAAIGTDAVTGSGPYTHTISQANTLASLTIEKNTGGFQSLQFSGCRVGKLTLKVPTGNEAATISADVTGQSAAVLTSPTAISVTNEIPFEFAEATATIFGTARYEAYNSEVMIDNGLKSTYTYSGNHGPSFVTPVTLHVNGTLDVVWDSYNDSTYGDYAKMAAQTLGSFSLGLQHPSGSMYGVTVTCPQVVYTKMGTDLKISDVVLSTLSYEASKQLTDGYTIQATVLNGVSTAYTG
jgi:Phage tail tube protein